MSSVWNFAINVLSLSFIFENPFETSTAINIKTPGMVSAVNAIAGNILNPIDLFNNK